MTNKGYTILNEHSMPKASNLSMTDLKYIPREASHVLSEKFRNFNTKNLTLTSIWYKGLGQAWGIGCGSIGIAVTSDTRDPWFESSN